MDAKDIFWARIVIGNWSSIGSIDEFSCYSHGLSHSRGRRIDSACTGTYISLYLETISQRLCISDETTGLITNYNGMGKKLAIDIQGFLQFYMTFETMILV